MRASFRVEKQLEAGPQTRPESGSPNWAAARWPGSRFETITSEIIDDPLARQRRGSIAHLSREELVYG